MGAATDASVNISSVDTRPSIDRYSIKYRSIIISVEYRPMYRPVDILGGSPVLHQYFTFIEYI